MAVSDIIKYLYTTFGLAVVAKMFEKYILRANTIVMVGTHFQSSL
jgi:hypothetical protein